jgi:hypothetical protein
MQSHTWWGFLSESLVKCREAGCTLLLPWYSKDDVAHVIGFSILIFLERKARLDQGVT